MLIPFKLQKKGVVKLKDGKNATFYSDRKGRLYTKRKNIAEKGIGYCTKHGTYTSGGKECPDCEKQRKRGG